MAVSRSHIPKLGKTLEKFRDAAQKIVRARALEFANREKTAFVRRIERQDFKSFTAVPLNPAYKAHKISAGLDKRVMIRTSRYKDQIRVFVEKQGDKTVVRTGFKQGAKARHEDGSVANITLDLLAKVQEYGSEKAHVPARPHWGPHLQMMKVRAGKLRKKVQTEVAALWRSMVGKRP